MYFSVNGQFTTTIKWRKVPIDKHDFMFKIVQKTAVKRNPPKMQIHCSCNWCDHHLQRLLLPLSSVEDRLFSESSLDWDFQKKNLCRWWTSLRFREGFRFWNMSFKPPAKFFQLLLTLWSKTIQSGDELTGNPPSLSASSPVNSEIRPRTPRTPALGHTSIPNSVHSSPRTIVSTIGFTVIVNYACFDSCILKKLDILFLNDASKLLRVHAFEL